MNIDTLPDEADFVFFAEPLPEDGLHRVSIAVEGMDAAIPTMLVTVTGDSALGLDRDAWTARAERCLRAGAGVAHDATLH